MKEPAAQLPAQDFEAALHEVSSNLDVRRLTFVLANVLVPAFAMAMADAMSGSEWPESIAWLPRWIAPVAGAVLGVAGVVVSTVLARCHFGLVVNGSKMRCVRTGDFRASGLNWLGVTTNFTALSALSAGAGFALALLAWSAPLACAALILTPILVMAHLHLTHACANRLAARLVAYWQHGPVPLELEERHARLSLEATTADVSVIVTMAAALFAGAFSAMTNLGGIPSSLESAVPVAWIKDHGLAALSSYTTLSLLLSARMVVRLRLALAEHSSALARLRKETDDAWRFRVEERTFLLHLLVALLVAFSGTILAWTLGDALVGISTGVALGIVSVLSYPISLARERRRVEGKERKDSGDKATESAEAETVAEGTD